MILKKFVPAMSLAAGVIMLGVSGAAAASSSPQSWGAPETRQSADPRYGVQGGRVCEKICPTDNLPCDPLNFKIADGRCRGVMSSPR